MVEIPIERTSHYAWRTYKDEVIGLILSKERPDIIEIGAGRLPLFTAAELPENVSSYTINDLSQRELDLAPGEWRPACFDVCGDVERFRSRYDVVFTRMLAEHVPDGYRFHSNVLSLLKPGGIALHFMPTLFSPPFVINKIMPEWMSRWIVRVLFDNRTEDGVPKFPARYSMCYGESAGLIARYRSIGYADADIRTFYGHGYFLKIPVLRGLDRALTNFAYRRGLTWLGAYAYVKLVKPE